MNATSIYNEIQSALKGGERVAVATVVKTIGAAPCGVGTKMLVRADGTTSGSFSGSRVDTQVAQTAMQALREGQSSIAHVHLDPDQAVGSCGATLELFIEVLYPEPRLIIAGAGNVAQALARLATQLDYRDVTWPIRTYSAIRYSLHSVIFRRLFANWNPTRPAGSSSSHAAITSTRMPCVPPSKPLPAMLA
jgi:xanthine/CO dehydrogenase XdhC/CoxF family maturation factor